MYKEDIPVTVEDQELINTVAYLTSERKNLEKSMNQIKEVIQQVDDAILELDSTLEFDNVMLKIGESFVSGLEEDDLRTHCNKIKAQNILDLNKLTAKAEQIKEKLSDCKIRLYAKFGPDRIRLDE